MKVFFNNVFDAVVGIATLTHLVVLLNKYVDVNAYSPMLGMSTHRSTMSMKRGRGSFKNEIGDNKGAGSSSSSSSFSGGMAPQSSTGRNWYTIPNKKIEDLPAEEGKVGLLETQNILLVNKQTNPSGAVGVLKYEGQVHCFDVQCPQCKFPLTKAKVLPPNEETNNASPRVACDFCKSTYSLKTGERLKSQESAGIFGGIAKAVLGSQTSAPLAIYQLGEKDGKIMFSIN